MPAKKTKPVWYQTPLYRSDTDRIVVGVLGGLSEYTKIHVTLLRLAYVLLTAFTGIFPGILAYVIAAVILQPKSAQ